MLSNIAISTYRSVLPLYHAQWPQIDFHLSERMPYIHKRTPPGAPQVVLSLPSDMVLYVVEPHDRPHTPIDYTPIGTSIVPYKKVTDRLFIYPSVYPTIGTSSIPYQKVADRTFHLSERMPT